MNQGEDSVAGIAMETDGMETLPSKSRPLSEEDRNEIFRRYAFKCPVCGLTGGPTHLGGRNFTIFTMQHGIQIPADHAPECLDKADVAYFYLTGKLDEHQIGEYIHAADADTCSHPVCLALRLWGAKS